jgi:hypothetical protein
MKFLIHLFLLLFSFGACAQTEKKCDDCITAEDAKNKVGEVVKVIGTVKKVTSVTFEEGEPTFIDLDSAFPNVILNVVVFKDNLAKFDAVGLNTLVDKKVIVSGKVKRYYYEGNNKYKASSYPQIELKDITQLEVVK